MLNKKVLGLLLSFSLCFMASCYTDDKGGLLPLLGGATVASDDTTSGDAGSGGTVTPPPGDDTGDTTVPAGTLRVEDVKTMMNQILVEVDAGTLLQSIKDECADGNRVLVDKDTIQISAQVACNPFAAVLTVVMNQYRVEGIDCAFSGAMAVSVQFPTNATGTYLLTINTAQGAPIAVQGEECGTSTIAITDLSMCVTMVPFGSQFSGTVAIGGEVHEIAEFVTPADILELLKDAFDRIPWDEILKLLDSSGTKSGAPSASVSGDLAAMKSVYGTTYTVYNEDGLKVGVGLSDDWEIILELTFTGYKVDAASSTALNGTVDVLASFDSWDVLKLVCNTVPGAPLTISGIPLITPRIGLTDVTIHYDWYNEEIVDTGADSGSISLNGFSFDFDPSWITKIMDMLQ